MKAVKYIAIGLVAICAGLATLAVVGFPASFLIGPLQDRIRADTGYELNVAGSAWLTLVPTASIEVNDISLRDPASRTAKLAISAESLRAMARVTELFGDRPRITEIILVKPEVRTPLIRQRSAAAAAPAPRSTSSRRAAATIDRLRIQNGSVLFVNAADVIEGRLDDVEITASLDAQDQIVAHVSARSATQAMRLLLQGTAPPGGFDGRPVPLGFQFEAPGALHGIMTGTMEVRTTGSMIRFNNVNGTIGGNKFNGWSSVDFADKPLVKVELDFQRLDLGTVRAPGAGTSSKRDIGSPWSDERFSLESLNFVDAEVQLSAAALNFETFHFAPISVSATLNNGIVRAAFNKMGVYGGQATGGIAIDASRADHSYALILNTAGVRALPLLMDVANFSALDGVMHASIDVRAWGNSERAIMSSLDGTLSALLQEGEIRNVNVAQMIRNVAASILSGWQAGGVQKTDFTQFGAGVRFQAGQATTQNLQLMGPLVRVTGAGVADVGAKTLNFKLEPKLVTSLQGQEGTAEATGLGVPVIVAGTWAEPKIYPEFSGMLDNPDAAFTKLKEMGLGLIGSLSGPQGGTAPRPDAQSGEVKSGEPKPGDVLQGISEILKNLGGTRQDAAPPAAAPSTAPASR